MKNVAEAVKGMRDSRLLAGLREQLADLKRLSVAASQAEVQRKEVGAVTLANLREVDGDNGPGVRFDYDGVELAAYAYQPDTRKVWDTENLVEFLKKKGLWTDAVTVATLDPQKLEIEMAAGHIKRSDLARFQIDDKPGTPYVKFMNPKPESR